MLLQCGVDKCRTTIRGMTGLLEVQNLMRHLRRKHRLFVTMAKGTVLDWRIRFEDGERYDTKLGIWYLPETDGKK